MSDQSQQWLQEASAAVQAGQFEEALKLAEQSIEAEPSCEAWVIRGIALAQLSRPQDATAAFEEGIRLNPESPRAYYNLATHLYQQKQLEKARAMATEAIRCDPNNQSAKNLIGLIDQESGTSASEPSTWAQPPSQATLLEPESGAIPFVDKMGGIWNLIGIALIVISLVVTTYSWLIQGSLIKEVMENLGNEQKIKQITEQAQAAQRNNALLPIVSIFGWLALLGTLAWGCLDIANRRKSWLWLIGFIPCACCGFSFIILSVYMVAGRKVANPEP